MTEYHYEWGTLLGMRFTPRRRTKMYYSAGHVRMLDASYGREARYKFVGVQEVRGVHIARYVLVDRSRYTGEKLREIRKTHR